MLATKFTANRAVFPCFVQPKLNGVRCLWDGRTASCRSGRRHHPVIQAIMRRYPGHPDGLLDGELTAPGEPFEIVQAAVAGDETAAAKLSFATFDWIGRPDLAFRDRLEAIRDRIVETTWVQDLEGLESAYGRFLDEGYEGLIARDPAALYTPGKAQGLLKYKPFEDAEFPIVDVLEAGGKDAGTAMLVCQTPAGVRFPITPGGCRRYRMKIWRDRLDWIGKPYTVRFEGWTAYGAPRFARGVGERTDIRWVMSISV